MIIDQDNYKYLLLKSSKSTIIGALNIFSNRERIIIDNVFYELTRLLTIRDVDIHFLIKFLLDEKYIIKQKTNFKRERILDSDKAFVEFVDYYITSLQSFNDVFKSLFIISDFTIENEDMIINIDSVPLSYRQFFVVFQLLGIMKVSDKKGHNIILNYRIAKKVLERPLKKISQQQFDIEMLQKKERGNLAELFVMEHEVEKLKATNLMPKRVSIENVSLGYDIDSYHIDGANFFIEVKTLMYGNSFFWTKNEIKSAKLYSENYFIYCVLFDSNNNPLEIKQIIQDPYLKIFTNKEYIKESTGDFLIKI